MKHLDKYNKEIKIGDTVHVPAIEDNVNFEFTGRVDSFNPTDDYVVVVDQEDNAFCVEPELLEIETKSYLVTWEIDIEATSPEDAAREVLEIQRDETSEALAFTVKRQSTGEVTDVNLLDELLESQNEGKDICYGCGKVQEYLTMPDVDESFAIYCDKCLPVAKSVKELKEFNEMLFTNQEVDFIENDPNFEFITLHVKLNKIIENLEGNK